MSRPGGVGDFSSFPCAYARPIESRRAEAKAIALANPLNLNVVMGILLK
jgi:hypothetical protein